MVAQQAGLAWQTCCAPLAIARLTTRSVCTRAPRHVLRAGARGRAAMSSAVAASDRTLLRVRSQAFRGDAHALAAAQREIRSKFEEVRAAARRRARGAAFASRTP